MTEGEKKKGPIYRSRNGVILGVCRGVADHFGFPVFWLRLGVLFLFLTTGIWPTLIIYFAIALYLKPAPLIPLENESEREFYFSYTSSRLSAMTRLKKKFEQLNSRIRRMEDVVTSRDYSWKQRMG